MNLYSIGKPVVSLFYHFWFRIEVIGRENIPEQGGVLICCNHISDYDPPMVGISTDRELSFVAKEELFSIPLFGWLISHLNAFPIRRGTGDRGALRLAIRLLEKGHALLIFPEGHRNPDGRLRKGMSGAGFFALKTSAVIIPCAIIGKYKFRKKMRVVFGPPLNLTAIKAEKPRASEVSAAIMAHIQKLLDQYGS